MPNISHNQILAAMQTPTAITWMLRDARDDFFPDPIDYADLKDRETEYLTRRSHRLLQLDSLPHLVELVPKKRGLVREAVLMHPMHRVLYTALLRYFLPRLDRELLSQNYSYRVDTPEEPDAYPFRSRIDRWKNFQNDFRHAALQAEAGCVLVTDLAAYFDHIHCDQLGDRIRSMLGASLDSLDDQLIVLLIRLLKLFCTDGHGLPQNLDPSSFLCGVYLHQVDHEMVASGVRYFRWMDDIRVVASSRREAVQALHLLQRTLAKSRLYLATDKTFLYDAGSTELGQLLDVQDDADLGRIDEWLATSDCRELGGHISHMIARLDTHAGPQGDERKFRAYANRLRDTSDFSGLASRVDAPLRSTVIPRLFSHPERTDTWAKLLSVRPDQLVVQAVEKLLIDEPSLFAWQRFHLWRLALHLPLVALERLSEQAVIAAGSDSSDAVAAQAIVFIGARGTNEQREAVFRQHFSRQRGYVVQRAVLVAIQELPPVQRTRLYAAAVDQNGEHRELIDYLQGCSEPDYGVRHRGVRDCPEASRQAEHIIDRGVGLIDGRRVYFSLSRSDYDYD